MATNKDEITITPLSDRVVVRALTEEEAGTKSASGIIIPDTVSDKEEGRRGIVVAAGPGRWNEDGDKRIPMDVKVGDKIAFQSWKDKEKINGNEYWIISESDIQAIIN